MKVRVFTAIIIILVGGLVLTITSGAGWYREESTVAFAAGNLVRLHVTSMHQETDQGKTSGARPILKETEKLLVVEDRESSGCACSSPRGRARAAEELRKAGLIITPRTREFEFPERAYEFECPGRKTLHPGCFRGRGRNGGVSCRFAICRSLRRQPTILLSPEQIKLRWKAGRIKGRVRGGFSGALVNG